jgi:hypothetical protein
MIGLQCASIEQLASLFWARAGAVDRGDSTRRTLLVSTAEWETGRASTGMRRPMAKTGEQKHSGTNAGEGAATIVIARELDPPMN